jgi:hypothetical protein
MKVIEMATTIYVQDKNLEQLKNIQESMHGTQKVPYSATLDVLFRDKLNELNRGDEE